MPEPPAFAHFTSRDRQGAGRPARSRSWLVKILACLAAIAAGCQHESPRAGAAAAAVPSTAPATSVANANIFRDPIRGFSVLYPADWVLRNDPDPENVLTIDANAHDPNGPDLVIVVPKLPPHVPGIIPLPAVEHGYIEDLKKHMKNVTRLEDQRVKVAGALGRRFIVSGERASGLRKLVVLITVRGDRLYIMTGEAAPADYAAVRRAFDMAESSWSWLPKATTTHKDRA
jgi:hypothetical protein